MSELSRACVCGHVFEEASRFIGGKRFSGKYILLIWSSKLFSMAQDIQLSKKAMQASGGTTERSSRLGKENGVSLFTVSICYTIVGELDDKLTNFIFQSQMICLLISSIFKTEYRAKLYSRLESKRTRIKAQESKLQSNSSLQPISNPKVISSWVAKGGAFQLRRRTCN